MLLICSCQLGFALPDFLFQSVYPLSVVFITFVLYSTNQEKSNRERLTERILFPFCTCSRSRSIPVLYPFHSRSVSILYPFRSRSLSVPLVSALEICSEERCFRDRFCNFCNFRGENAKLLGRWEEDAIVASRPAKHKTMECLCDRRG